MEVLEILRLVLQFIALAVSVGILKWAQKKYDHWRKNRDQFRILQSEQNKIMMDEIKAIKHQVQPNGGSSLNDKVGKVADHLIDIDRTLIDLKIGQRNNREIQGLATWESDENGRVYYVSNNLCDMIGCTQNDVLANGWVGLVAVEDRKRVFTEWTESVNTGYDFSTTFSFRKSDGKFQKVSAVAIHNRDANGKVVTSLCRLIKIEEPYKN